MKFILLFLVSCMKQPVNHDAAKKMMQNENCVDKLKDLMTQSGCDQLDYKIMGDHDIMIRCHKHDKDRKTFWDTYAFRISPANIVYRGADKRLIDSHNICIDDEIRIGAYSLEEDLKL